MVTFVCQSASLADFFPSPNSKIHCLGENYSGFQLYRPADIKIDKTLVDVTIVSPLPVANPFPTVIAWSWSLMSHRLSRITCLLLSCGSSIPVTSMTGYSDMETYQSDKPGDIRPLQTSTIIKVTAARQRSILCNHFQTHFEGRHRVQ